MKTNFVKSILFLAMAAGTLTGCVNDDDYSVPQLECDEPNIAATKTVQEIYDAATPAATLYEGDDIIEAVVVSSDKGGNFYKTLYLNNIVTNGSGELAAGDIGFSVQVNQADLFTDYNVGRRVFINLNGLYTQIRSNTLQIGALYNGNIGQIATTEYQDHIMRSCTIIPEENLIKPVANLDAIDDSYIGKLIKLETVQFSDASLGQTYYNADNVDGGGQTLTYIVDTEGNSGEGEVSLPFRTSSFADYAGTEVSSNSGSIIGILTKFNTTYQFVSRYEEDIMLTEERSEVPCQFSDLTATKTVQDIANMATADATEYTADDIIEGIVVSSDEDGHFYKTLYLNSTDGTIGFSVQINQTDLFNNYEVGRKVYILLQGLYIQERSNTLQIGALYNGNVGQISADEYPAHIKKSCDVVPEEDLIVVVNNLEDINDSFIGKLIRFEGVQFTDASLNQTYYNAANVDGGGQTLTYITQSEEETNTLPFRTSSFASFADVTVAQGNGTITGILTKFNTTYQFVARYADDINLTGERIGDAGDGGSNDIVFEGSLTEDFEGFASGTSTLNGYVNDVTVGDRYWEVKDFSDNQYLQMTSYDGSSNPGVDAKSYFFVPVDFTAANTLSFDKKIRYMAGEALKVYYVSTDDYTAGGTITVSNFTEITSSFANLTYPANGQSDSDFSNAGTYNIPTSLTGNGFFVFEYTGGGTVTTTVQLDNITIN